MSDHASPQGRELEWGETPWDDMPREQLLREVQRMYSAVVSARSSLAIIKHADPSSPFWGLDGTGGHALAKAEQALAPYPNEPAYRSFFRYADDLLFDGLGSNWQICDKCNQMTGAPSGMQVDRACFMCPPKERGGPLRPLRWDDLKPKASR